jgi:ribonuclease T2
LPLQRYAGFIALFLVVAAGLWLTYADRPSTVERTPPPVAAPQANRDAGKPADQTTKPAPAPGPMATTTAVPRGTGFDFYVLALSWSPTFCAQNAAGNDQQCASGRDHGFIVHGLWPQNERGYPQDCASGEPDRVPQALGRSLFDIMPGMGLIGHEWRKHGSCSGLSQKDYFSVLRTARERIILPPALDDAQHAQTLDATAIESMLVSANPGLSRAGVALSCDRNRLEEVRICLSKDLGFRDCAEVDRQGCTARNIVLPQAR